MSGFTFTTFIERDDDELEVRVSYTVSPYYAATGPTYNCGGTPAEGGEVDISEAVFVESDTRPSPLTDAEYDTLIARCEERSSEDMADREADRGDYLYEQQRDRQMTDAWERSA